MMTTLQRRLFFGGLCEGLSSESAADAAGVTVADVLEQQDTDVSFRVAYQFAEFMRDEYVRFSSRLIDEEE